MKLTLRYFAVFLSLFSLALSVEASNAEYICVPIPARPANSQDPYNAGSRIPEANIQVRIEGKQCKRRPTIVFIHGFAEDLSEWDCTQKALKDCYRTIAFDLRGFGRSSRTPAPFPPAPPATGETNYSIQVFTDDIQAVLSQLGITDNIILVGRSIGASIAINYATSYPGVKKLVLVSSAPQFFVDCSVSPLPPCIVTPANVCSSCGSTCSCSPECCSLYPANPCVKNPLCCIYPQSIEVQLGVVTAVDECVASCGTNTECALNCVLDIVVKPLYLNEACTNPAFLTLQENFSRAILAQLTSPNPNEIPILFSTTLVAASQNIRNLVPLVSVPTLICFGSIDTSADPRNSLYIHQRIKNSILAEFCGKGHELNLSDVKGFDKLLAGFIGGKKYPCSLKIGRTNCCNVCPTSYTVLDFTECTPTGSAESSIVKKV